MLGKHLYVHVLRQRRPNEPPLNPATLYMLDHATGAVLGHLEKVPLLHHAIGDSVALGFEDTPRRRVYLISVAALDK